MAGKPEAQEALQNTPLSFEQSLAQLESLVSQLESGDLPLDQALARFEQGVRLTRDCQSALSVAQQKVQLLLQRGENITLEDFDPVAGGQSDPGPSGPSQPGPVE
ncbi:MAG: exodeoxyribonuclease VII small subunit [Steroidobacteraceae bacterium]